jgi:hypothetical protein
MHATDVVNGGTIGFEIARTRAHRDADDTPLRVYQSILPRKQDDETPKRSSGNTVFMRGTSWTTGVFISRLGTIFRLTVRM